MVENSNNFLRELSSEMASENKVVFLCPMESTATITLTNEEKDRCRNALESLVRQASETLIDDSHWK